MEKNNNKIFHYVVSIFKHTTKCFQVSQGGLKLKDKRIHRSE
jgi:hypothetical protein